MTLFDITPAGAYVNAIRAANERDRQEAVRRPAIEPAAARPSLRLALAKALRQTLAHATKSTTGLVAAADIASRTA